ncbi:MAG: hypothetical protein AAF645_22195, partial [Myxococcota bacterium]
MTRAVALAIALHALPGLASALSFSPRTLVVAVDDDDDDDDSTPDRLQEAPPLQDAVRVHLLGEGEAVLRFPDAVRVLWAGRPLASGSTVRLPSDVRVQGLAPESGELSLHQGSENATLPFRAHRVALFEGERRLDPTVDALVPQRFSPELSAPPEHHIDALHVEVHGAMPAERWGLSSYDADGRRDTLSLASGTGESWRSGAVRLVTDHVDGQSRRPTLRVAVRDRVEVQLGDARQSIYVGRPYVEENGRAARRLRVAVTLLAAPTREGAVPLLGATPEDAIRLGEAQLDAIADVWAQCLIDVEGNVRLAASPAPSVLSFGDARGLPSRGGPLEVRAGEETLAMELAPNTTPRRAARAFAELATDAGFVARSHRVPTAAAAAGPAWDVQLFDAEGDYVTLEVHADGGGIARLGAVDLADGLLNFDNGQPGGTLEERALVLGLRDERDKTLDLFIINDFVSQNRNGEAFIAADGGPAAGAVIIDASGVELTRYAWTGAHELGHVLLDDPFHPDNRGPDTPYRLMDSNAADGTTLG